MKNNFFKLTPAEQLLIIVFIVILLCSGCDTRQIQNSLVITVLIIFCAVIIFAVGCFCGKFLSFHNEKNKNIYKAELKNKNIK